ncbi:hypothetical protein LTR85_007632 [Meristemomyces frigidus]|nr:hypothetical protein LTR85_007632 [Meristemomyces frigidus]
MTPKLAPYVHSPPGDHPAAKRAFMSLPPAYTALESLLLFQALRAEGCQTEPFSFSRISSQLKSIPSIRNDASYDEGRLSPDALRDCYLRLVKEEVRKDRHKQLDNDNDVANGDASPASRKRKLSSPTLPTVGDAAQWPHLIPQLVGRLYKTYRDSTIRELREYERQYDALSRDISEVDAGQLDERLQRQKSVAATQSPKPSTTAHTQPALQRPEYAQPGNSITASPTSSQKPAEPSTKVPSKPYSTAKIDAVMNHGPEPEYGQGSHRRTSSNTTLPPLSEMAPQSPRFGIPPKMPGPVPAHMQHLQPQGPGHGYAHSPPSAHQSPYAPHHGHPVPSPQLQNTLLRPSSSPRPILPPPPGMKLPPPTPPQHSGSPSLRGPPLPLQQHYQPQHRSSMAPSPTNDRPPRGYQQQLPLPPPPPNYYQQQPYIDRRTSYPPPQGQPTPSYAAQPPHRGGHQLQPFVLDGSQPAKAQHRQAYVQQHTTPRPPQPLAHVQRPPPYPLYPSAPATAPRPQAPPHSRLISDIVAALATPPQPLVKPLWKSERRAPPLPLPTPPPAPEYEPLSPLTQRARPVSTRKRDDEPSEEHVEHVRPLPPGKRRRQLRDGSPGSTASSPAGETTLAHTRSHSVSTAVDGRPGSRGSVKLEPSTPANVLDQPEHGQEPSATPASGPMTRKRRGTLQSQAQPTSKRKRQASPTVTEEGSEAVGTPPPRPTTVTATRNFAKMAATIMNDITSHKHASYFASPVRDKDASGYSEIIKQPQHLKSVRAAITAGTRAIAAATSSMDSPSATPSALTSKAADGSTTVELERTIDLIPPKAIVNGAQLEKEVYRMFANAVMFNPGEDGLVSDTREMFQDVEAKIRDWRGAERELGGDEEDDGKAKRRKL